MGKRDLWKVAGVCAVIVIVALTISLNVAIGEDVGDLIQASPTVGWDGTTSNTALIFGFWTGGSQGAACPSSWTSTDVQYFRDGTTRSLMRNVVWDWLFIENLTTHTLFITLNAGRNGVGSLYINETTPTLDRTVHQFQLTSASSGLRFSANFYRSEDAPLFPPLENVGVYIYDGSSQFETSATFQSRITSQTVRIFGR